MPASATRPGSRRWRADELRVEVRLDPLAICVRRGGRTLIDGLALWTRAGTGRDRLITLTEGVVVEETRELAVALGPATVTASGRHALELAIDGAGADGNAQGRAAGPRPRRARPRASPRPRSGSGPSGPPSSSEHLTGLGARHGEAFDQRGRLVHLGADRRYTGPDCPPEMLDQGGIPQGDYVPAPWLNSSAGWAAWVETWGAGLELDLRERVSISQRGAAGPLRLRLLCDRTPAARLRHYLRLTGLPALLPEWAYGHWKSRDVYEHQRDVIEDFEGYRAHRAAAGRDRDRLAVGDAVQHLALQPPPVPGPARDGRADARRRGADGRLGDAVGEPRLQRRPAPARPRVRAPAPPRLPRTTPRASGPGTTSAAATAGPTSAAGGWGSARRSTSPRRPPGAGGRSRRGPVLEMGVEGIKADDGEGYYIPPEARFADGRTGAEAAWAYGDLYRAHDAGGPRPRSTRTRGSCSAAAAGAASRRPGSPGAATRLGLLVAADAGRGHPDRLGQRLLELVARRRRLSRQAPRASAARASCCCAGSSSAASRR